MEREEGTSVEPEWSIMSRLDGYFILRERERERDSLLSVEAAMVNGLGKSFF